MSKLIDFLEKHIGHWAIPSLLRILALLHVMTWGVLMIHPEIGHWLECDPELIKHGEWWRLFSWVFLSQNVFALWVLLGCLFMWRMSDALEEGWGPFRLNLYILASWACCVAAAFIWGSGIYNVMLLITAIFFAYATMFPNEEIMMLPLPIMIKVKWMAMVQGIIMALWVLQAPLVMWPVVLALLPYLIVFVPDLFLGTVNQIGLAQRRTRFAAATRKEGEALHRCSRCGKTDSEHPQLDFRVNADGDDVCAECRGK